MARCKECIHNECCSIFIPIRVALCDDDADKKCELFKSTADVVPKSEVEALEREIARLKKSTLPSYCQAVSEEEAIKIGKQYGRAEVAREIFEEIYKVMNSLYLSVQHSCVGMHGDNPETMRLIGKLEGVTHLGDEIAELKKKYTEEKHEMQST